MNIKICTVNSTNEDQYITVAVENFEKTLKNIVSLFNVLFVGLCTHVD